MEERIRSAQNDRFSEHVMVSDQIRQKTHLTEMYPVPLVDTRDTGEVFSDAVIFEQTFNQQPEKLKEMSAGHSDSLSLGGNSHSNPDSLHDPDFNSEVKVTNG
eukprot:1153528_1